MCRKIVKFFCFATILICSFGNFRHSHLFGVRLVLCIDLLSLFSFVFQFVISLIYSFNLTVFMHHECTKCVKRVWSGVNIV